MIESDSSERASEREGMRETRGGFCTRVQVCQTKPNEETATP
jgi:hypothetical protein